MCDIRWLHISDLHFGDKRYDTEKFRSDILDKLSKLSEIKTFQYLFITGDIIYGKIPPNQRIIAYDEAIDYINRICKIMNIPIKNTCIVPGNHDVIRNRQRSKTVSGMKAAYSPGEGQVNADQSFHDEDIYEKAFLEFCNFYEKLTNREFICNHHNLPYDDINVLHINTALFSDQSLTDYGQLIVGTKDLIKACQEIDISKPTLAIAHHSFSWFRPEEAELIEKLFNKYNITLYLCGHIHVPRVHKFMRMCHNNWIAECLCPTYLYGEQGTSRGFFTGNISIDRKSANYNSYQWSEDTDIWNELSYPVSLSTQQLSMSTEFFTYDNKNQTGESQATKKDIEIGTIIKLGKYPQTSDTALDNIEWIVLDIQNNFALLTSKHCLMASNFKSRGKAEWASSNIRKLLNEDFYNTAFAENEQLMLKNSGENMYFPDSKDMVFLLSKEQIDTYFKLDKCATATIFAINQNTWINDINLCYWWTRTSINNNTLLCVSPTGKYEPAICNYKHGGVRPSIILNIPEYLKTKSII